MISFGESNIMIGNEERIKSTIKQLLKKQGANYKKLASELGVSLPTVRRFLTSDSLSIERLSKICDFLKITFPELIQISFHEQKETEPLSEELEEIFVKHPDMYTVLRYLGRGIEIADISKQFNLSPKRVQEYLQKLESLKLIQIQKNNFVHVLIRWPAPWRKNGPLFKKFGRDLYWRAVDHFYEKTIQNDGVYNNKGFYFFLDSVLLSHSTYEEYVRDVRQLKEKYYHLSQIEQKSLQPNELKVINALLGIDQVDLLAKVMASPK